MRVGHRLTLYVLRELIPPTLLAFVLWSFTLLMNAFFLVARTAVAKNLGWDTTIEMFAYEVPRIFVLTIPMATLLGTLIGIGRISADQEWVALQGTGLGPAFLIRPVAIHGAVATGLCLVVYGVFVPQANYGSRQLVGRVLMASNLAADLRPRVFYDDLSGAVLFVDEIRAGTEGRLERVLVYEPPGPGATIEQLILAQAGDLYPLPERGGALEVDLHGGILHAYRSASPDGYRVSRFGRYRLQLKAPAYLRGLGEPPDRTVQDMGTADLLAEARQAREERDPVLRPYRLRRVWTEIHQRLALPSASFLFAILAMPLGITRARSGKGAGFAVSLAVILVYWVVFTVARDQATRGGLPVELGVWGANLVMGLWILYAYLRVPMTRAEGRRSLVAGVGDLWGRALRSRAVTAPGAAPTSYRARFVGLVDRYLIARFLRIFVLALLAGCIVYAIVELKGLLDGVFQNRRPFSMVLRYYKYFAPSMLEFTVPVAALVAGIVTFTLLARTGELTAMKASGVSMRRAVAPVIAVTLVLCALLFLVQDKITPETSRKALEVRDEIFARAPRTYGLSSGGRWTFGTDGRLYHYRLFDPAEQRFQGLTVFTLDRSVPRILDHRFATAARWNGRAWTLEQGWYRSFPPDGAVGSYRDFERESARLDPPEHFSRREATLALGGDLPGQMSLEELGRQIDGLRNSGYDTTRLEVAYFAKWSHPLTPLVMLLLGLPFAFRIGRSGSLYAIGVAVLLVIIYWATLATFNALGLETLLPPWLAAWAPNVLFGLAGTYLLLYVRT